MGYSLEEEYKEINRRIVKFEKAIFEKLEEYGPMKREDLIKLIASNPDTKMPTDYHLLEMRICKMLISDRLELTRDSKIQIPLSIKADQKMKKQGPAPG